MNLDSKPTAVNWVCVTCGTQFGASSVAPDACPICTDERQYVGWDGQGWTTRVMLQRDHQVVFEVEEGVTTLRLEPTFAIGQRAFLIPHDDGLVMWESLSVVTPEAVAQIKAMGNVTAIAISHPHFYAAMVDWSRALGDVPIFLHARDRAWVQRNSETITFWENDFDLATNVRLIHLGGHFAGSSALLWQEGPDRPGNLFPGDAIQVVADRTYTTFMYSYPNMIPLSLSAVKELRLRVAGLSYENVFGYSSGRQMIGYAKRKVEQSFDRYEAALTS